MNILGWILIIWGLLSIGFVGGWVARELLHESTPPRLPTIAEIQQRIGCSKIDGVWGPETNVLYNRAICNQYAIETFKEAEKHGR